MPKDGSAQRWISRRSFLYNTALAGGSLIAAATPTGRALAQAPAIITADSRRIATPYGVQAGDLSGNRAIVWSRADRPARMIVEAVQSGKRVGVTAPSHAVITNLLDEVFEGHRWPW